MKNTLQRRLPLGLKILSSLLLAAIWLRPAEVHGQLYAEDIGSPLPAGSAVENGGVITIQAGGADIWGNSDQFHFLRQSLTGDGEIVARVTSLGNTHGHAKAGVMMRSTVAANSAYAFCFVTPTNGRYFQKRTTTGGYAANVSSTSGAAPTWVKLVRSGSNFTGFVSADASTWTQVGAPQAMALPATIEVGLAVTSHNQGQATTAVFDQVVFPGDSGGGAQFDAFSRIEAELFTAQSGVTVGNGGSGQKVGSIENGTWIRFDDVDFGPGAASVRARVASNNIGGTIQFRLGSTTGALIASAPVVGTGGWSNYVDVQVPVSGAGGVQDLYLVFVGGSGSLFDIDHFEFFPAAGASLAATDVGAVAHPGTVSEANGVYTIEGSGADIGGASDQFHYVYRPLFGDGVLTARVASIEHTTQYAKGAVMLRDSLAPDARHFTTLANAGGNIRFLRRLTPGGTTLSSGNVSGLPRWLRIARAGNVITSSQSTNGTSWTTLGTETVTNLPDILYVGMAVTAQTNSQLATAVFDNVSFPTVVDSDGDGLPDGWETANGLNPNNGSDAALDPDGDGLTNLQEYWARSNPQVSNAANGGTVTVSAVTPAAYEIDVSPGLLRLSRTGGTAAATVNYSVTGGVSEGDFVLKDPAGNVLDGSVNFPAGATTLDLTVVAVADGFQEFPEVLSFTVLGGAGHLVGSPNTAAVTVYDARDIPANEQLFVAYLTPVQTPGGTSSASGLVQLYLNGPKTAARVSVTHNGLTSGQVNTYLRWGLPGGPGPELRPNLGTGNLTNVVWNIQSIPQATGQDIIDGLYQNGGKYVYLDIATTNYPQGEIAGTFVRRTGSATFTTPGNPPPVPPASGNDLKREVTRFLTQATFGPTQAEIDALVNRVNTQYAGDRMACFSAWIDEQLAQDFSSHYAYLHAWMKRDWGGNVPPQMTYTYNPGRASEEAWWTTAIAARDQLRQRYAFALSEILVIARTSQPLSSFPAGPLTYYDALGSGTAGNFRNLLEDVSKHPVMGEYLSHKKNRKATYNAQGKLISSPDENYAREIMQLFSIGLAQLHPDGTLKLDATGALIPTYNNVDIANLARVFTGWSYGMQVDLQNLLVPIPQTNFNAGTGAGDTVYSYFPYHWMYPMRNFPAEHDTGAKTFLGSTVPAGLDGEADLDAALDIIFNHPNVAPFISRLLIQRLVTSNPSKDYVYRVAQKFNNNGSGVRGDMKAVVKAILLDYEARSLPLSLTPTYGKQKEPLVRYVQLLRSFNAQAPGLVQDFQGFLSPDQLDNYVSGAYRYSIRGVESAPYLGQFPLSAPSVFNWFLPDYSPQGPIAAAGLVAPEMTIATESSVFSVINFFHQMTHSYGVDSVVLNLNSLAAQYDALKAGGATNQQASEAMFDQLDLQLTAGSFKALYGAMTGPNPRVSIINAVASVNEYYSINRVKELVYLITTSPEYIHQR